MEVLFQTITVVVYAALAAIALWGAFCVVLVWRRLAQTRFRSETEQDEFLEDIDQSLSVGDYDGALATCQGDPRALPQLVVYAIGHRALGIGRLRRKIGERFQQDVLADIEHRLGWVATVVKSAPMIGLLGTVIGMMGAFANLSSGAKVDPTRMAEDIQFALITTACGLAIAVPLVLASASVQVRIRKLEDLVASGAGHFLEQLGQSLQRWPPQEEDRRGEEQARRRTAAKEA